MSTTRKIQNQLATNNPTATVPSTTEPANTTLEPKQNSSYKYIRITVNDNNVILSGNLGEFLVPDTDIEISNENQDKLPKIKLGHLNHETKSIFFEANERYQIELFFRTNNTTIKLPENFRINLLNFIQSYKPTWNPDYCCVNFVYEMEYGRESTPCYNSAQYFHYYQSSPDSFSEDILSCGDVVHLYDDEYKMNHYAIYLDQQYYISLIGSSGPLLISTLDQIKKIYSSTHVANIRLFSEHGKFSYGDTSYPAPNQYIKQDPISQSPTTNTWTNFFRQTVMPVVSDMGAAISACTSFIKFA